MNNVKVKSNNRLVIFERTISINGPGRKTYRRDIEDMTNMMEVRVRKRLAMKGMGVRQVDDINFVFCSDGKSINFLGVPLHSANGVMSIRRWRDTQEKATTEENVSRGRIK